MNGVVDSATYGARTWKKLRYWQQDHGTPGMGEGLDPDVSAVMEDPEIFWRMAGIRLEKKIPKSGRPTMPPREYVSGDGNKSPIPRSWGTGAGDSASADLKKPKNDLDAAYARDDAEEGEDDDGKKSKKSEAFRGTFDSDDISILAEETMPIVKAAEKAKASKKEKVVEDRLMDLVFNTPSVTP